MDVDGFIEAALKRGKRPGGIDALHAQVVAAHYCSRPVRLRSGGGRIGVYKSCGDRRSTRCPVCAEIYRGDARHLVVSGLHGGKGITDEVAAHPVVFATLTAPSFGRVHAVATECNPGRPGRCLHDGPTACTEQHVASDPRIGQPLCSECYDYDRHVLWHASVSELWRRTMIGAHRALASRVQMPQRRFATLVRLAHAKVVEYQARGAIHVHAVVRADAPDGSAPTRDVTAAELLAAMTLAARTATVPCAAGAARWGPQLDLQVVSADDAGRFASYLAKYVTKSTDAGGVLTRPVKEADLPHLTHRGLTEHEARLVRTAWALGSADPRLRRWAHTYGFPGHCLTKSRGFSTTLGALRAARAEYRRAAHPDAAPIPPGTLRAIGAGYELPGDHVLARQWAEDRIERRRLAWEELTSITPGEER